jgi:hypothetical protein
MSSTADFTLANGIETPMRRQLEAVNFPDDAGRPSALHATLLEEATGPGVARPWRHAGV